MILHSHILYNSNIIIYENFLSQYMVLHFTLSFYKAIKQSSTLGSTGSMATSAYPLSFKNCIKAFISLPSSFNVR